MDQKEDYRRKFEENLEKLNRRIADARTRISEEAADLREKVSEQSAEAKSELREGLDALERQRTHLAAKMEQFTDASEDRWEDLKEELEEAFDESRGRLSRFWDRLRGDDAPDEPEGDPESGHREGKPTAS